MSVVRESQGGRAGLPKTFQSAEQRHRNTVITNWESIQIAATKSGRELWSDKNRAGVFRRWCRLGTGGGDDGGWEWREQESSPG